MDNIKEETRKRKVEKNILLSKLRINARNNIWYLNKHNYKVYIDYTQPDKQWRELKYSEIYEFEKFWIYENKICILQCISYSELDGFQKLCKKYVHLYGKRHLHEYTTKLLLELYIDLDIV